MVAGQRLSRNSTLQTDTTDEEKRGDAKKSDEDEDQKRNQEVHCCAGHAA